MVVYAILAKFELLTFAIFRKFFNFGNADMGHDNDYSLDTPNKGTKFDNYNTLNTKSSVTNLD
jgi:hypothetical protein